MEFRSWEESYAVASCRIDLTCIIALLSFSRRYFLWETDKLRSLSSSVRRLSASEIMSSHLSWSRSSISCRITVSYWRLKFSALCWKCARASGRLWWGGGAIVGNVLILEVYGFSEWKLRQSLWELRTGFLFEMDFWFLHARIFVGLRFGESVCWYITISLPCWVVICRRWFSEESTWSKWDIWFLVNPEEIPEEIAYLTTWRKFLTTGDHAKKACSAALDRLVLWRIEIWTS